MMEARNTVLVTGAAGYLGSALCRAFYAEGYRLILHGRQPEPLQALAAELERGKKGGDVSLWVQDLATLTDEAVPEALFSTDILINNAAIQEPVGLAEDTTYGEWERAFRVNVLAPICLCRVLLKAMRKREFGRIINISGGGASAPRPFFAAYGAAKTALIRFTETLAHETIDSGISVNAVAPGAMPSAMLSAVVQPDCPAGDNEKSIARNILRDPGASPESAVSLCLWLASRQSSLITGRLISAQWDNWRDLHRHASALNGSDLFTLRRIAGRDRRQEWADR